MKYIPLSINDDEREIGKLQGSTNCQKMYSERRQSKETLYINKGLQTAMNQLVLKEMQAQPLQHFLPLVSEAAVHEIIQALDKVSAKKAGHSPTARPTERIMWLQVLRID